jgi:toxin HigB-1
MCSVKEKGELLEVRVEWGFNYFFCLMLITCHAIISLMIKTFRSKGTERLFARLSSNHFTANLHRAAWKKLAILDAAEKIEDLRIPPGNHLEKLSGDRQGEYSIRINDQWRICFHWRQGNAYDVEIADYH